ncbi:MAG: glycosidase [Novipirellula sp. JB048]
MWHKTNLIEPSAIQPSDPRCRVIGAFNPGAVRIDETVHLLVRVAEQPIPTAADHVDLPRFDLDGRLQIDRYHRDELQLSDARVAVVRESGLARLTSVSHLRHFTVPVASIADPAAYRETGHRFWPAGVMETQGVEDARLTPIDGRCYFTYVAVSEHGVCTALASTSDFVDFERHGVIFPCENKDVLLFPERVGNRYFALHRPVPATPLCTPEMWIAQSDNLLDWGSHRVLVDNTHARAGEAHDTRGEARSEPRSEPRSEAQEWSGGRVGGGTPPIETEAGWASLYQANQRSQTPGPIGRYCGGGLLFDRENPIKIVAMSSQPILVPDQPFETAGFVPQVVFPTAWIDVGEQACIFYGAADTSTAVAITNRQPLIQSFHR